MVIRVGKDAVVEAKVVSSNIRLENQSKSVGSALDSVLNTKAPGLTHQDIINNQINNAQKVNSPSGRG